MTMTTLQKNNDDDDWEDDDDSLEEEEEDDESSFWTDLKETWRQHFIAIFIALMATALAYRSSSNTTTFTPILEAHAHLDSYQRTANLSFCPDQSLSPNTKDLAVLDFSIPAEYTATMAKFFAADKLQDNDYSQVLERDFSNDKHVQVQCMKQQTSSIKGQTYYYETPSFDSMYEEQPSHSVLAAVKTSSKSKLSPAHLTFAGFCAKFINLSNQPVLLYWDGREDRKLVGEIAPFQALGTATTPGQSFSVTPVYDSDHHLNRWVVTADEPILYYEVDDTEEFSKREMELYRMQKLNQAFARDYHISSGRHWLSNFPRALPIHYMWPADYFGQQHLVSQNYALTVASVTPRVYTIPTFLTKLECQQLIQLAETKGFTKSSLYAGSMVQRDRKTRSSSNAWLARETNALTDDIYQRAARLLQIDEALLQAPLDDDIPAHAHSLAESLQVVHYQKGEEYTAHHDFVFPHTTHRHQPTRFATLLMYLNDDYRGGQTVFPRAVNAQHHEGITIQPKQGMAVLFYNVLPDGNVDDLSQHASQPVESGEKFLANLWIWEPMIH